jgi:hypothetical protein
MKKLLLILLLPASLTCAGFAADVVQISAAPDNIVSTNFLGFGVQWSPYPWFDLSDAAWERCFQRLDFMRLPLARVMNRAYNYCNGFDAQGQPIYAWDNNHMQKMYRLLDYCQKHNVTVIIGEWDDPASPEDRADIASDKLQAYKINCTDPRWARLIGDFLDHMIRDKGYTCLKYYNLINEPNGDWSHCFDFDKWKTAVNNLYTELHKRGLDKTIQIIGPDATGMADYFWLDRAVLGGNKIIGAYDIHGYVNHEDLESGFYEKLLWQKRDYINRFDPNGRRKPFFMGEMGMSRRGPVEPQGGEDSHPKVYEHIYGVWMTDYSIQLARAGMQGGIAWDLDDAMHIFNYKDTKWPDIHKTLFKKWGFWNSLAEEIGHPEDANLRPWFYTWSLMSRYFPPGCSIVQTRNSEVKGFRTLAASVGAGGFTFCAVNDDDTPREALLIAPAIGQPLNLRRYLYAPNDYAVDGNGFAVPRETVNQADLTKGIRLSLPARSVALLTTLGAE